MRKRPRPTPARRTEPARPLVDRIVDSPQLTQLVPTLPADAFQRLIAHVGLEDCSALVALMTPAQLDGVLDLDLWRSPAPGLDEQFDPERFGRWLEVLLDTGAENAARVVAALDPALVVAGFAHHVRVFDPAAAEPSDIESFDTVGRRAAAASSCEIGGYLIVPSRTDFWDAVVMALAALDSDEPARFHEVMRGCRRLSNSAPELDGLDDLLPLDEQHAFDVSDERDRRRERRGFVTAADARAFLQFARDGGFDADGRRNRIASAYLENQPEQAEGAEERERVREPAPSPAREETGAPHQSARPLIELLVDAGVLRSPRALLQLAPGSERPLPIETCMQAAYDRDETAFARRNEELVFLANTLIAGCPLQQRAFTRDEAMRAAVAVCNVGLEYWPGPRTDDLLVAHDLVTLFEGGWHVLYRDVCVEAARALISALGAVVCSDRELQRGLTDLRQAVQRQLEQRTPWRASVELDVIMAFDIPAWAALVGLMAECPILHGALVAERGRPLHRIDPAAFRFITGRADVERAQAFLGALPAALHG